MQKCWRRAVEQLKLLEFREHRRPSNHVWGCGSSQAAGEFLDLIIVIRALWLDLLPASLRDQHRAKVREPRLGDNLLIVVPG